MINNDSQNFSQNLFLQEFDYKHIYFEWNPEKSQPVALNISLPSQKMEVRTTAQCRRFSHTKNANW